MTGSCLLRQLVINWDYHSWSPYMWFPYFLLPLLSYSQVRNNRGPPLINFQDFFAPRNSYPNPPATFSNQEVLNPTPWQLNFNVISNHPDYSNPLVIRDSRVTSKNIRVASLLNVDPWCRKILVGEKISQHWNFSKSENNVKLKKFHLIFIK